MPADKYMGAAGKLKNIIIPQNVTAIGSGAFWGAALEAITIPHNVSDVGNYAFRDCTFLKSVRYEGAVIGGYMFVNCSSMREFTIAKTVTKIGEHCFY